MFYYQVLYTKTTISLTSVCNFLLIYLLMSVIIRKYCVPGTGCDVGDSKCITKVWVLSPRESQV